MQENVVCELCHCNDLENATHHFSGCGWIKDVSMALQAWLDIHLPLRSVHEMLQMIKQKHWHLFKKVVVAATYGALIYQVRMARNYKIFKGVHVNTNFVIQ